MGVMYPPLALVLGPTNDDDPTELCVEYALIFVSEMPGILTPLPREYLCPTVASLVETLLPQYLESRAYTTVTGGAEEMSFILSLKYNHLFLGYTALMLPLGRGMKPASSLEEKSMPD